MSNPTLADDGPAGAVQLPDPGQAHRAILRSTSIIGGASILNIAMMLVRTKVAALVLGPAGLGLVGLLISLMTTAGTFASWGIGNVATRQVAEAGEDVRRAAAARRAMLLAAIGLGAVGVLVVFAARDKLASSVLDDPRQAGTVGWLALGVGLLVLFNAAVGILTGFRRIGDVARVSVASAMLATAVAVAALVAMREQAVVAFVLAGPAASALVALFFLGRVRQPGTLKPTGAELTPHWRALASLGLAFTAAAVVAAASQVALRALVQRELGPVALGHFHASWQISTNYIGFILTAMAVDYYPRLTAVIRDRAQASEAINRQGEVAMLLAGPILVATVGFSHWLVPLLYSSAFLPLIELLRWQIVGDLLKVAAWPLAMVMVAAGRGRLFVITEVLAAALLVGLTALLLPGLGLRAPGVAYVTMTALYLPVMVAIARNICGFRFSARLAEAFLAVAVALGFTVAAAASGPWVGAVAGGAFGFALAGLALYRLRAALPPVFGKWFKGA